LEVGGGVYSVSEAREQGGAVVLPLAVLARQIFPILSPQMLVPYPFKIDYDNFFSSPLLVKSRTGYVF
jgi:hypothetical protein